MERVRRPIPPVGGRTLENALGGPAELLEHDERTRAEAALAQGAGDGGGAVGPGDVGHDPAPGLEHHRDRVGGATHGADELDLRRRPAEPCAGEREGRGCG
jgi:hypothetical protein